jgi:hypothetical protein
MAADKGSTKTKQGHVTPPSETLPVRKLVSFCASNMVVEEVLDDNGESIITQKGRQRYSQGKTSG